MTDQLNSQTTAHGGGSSIMRSLPVLVGAGCALVGLTSMVIPGFGQNSAFAFGAGFGMTLGAAAVGMADLLSRSRVGKSLEHEFQGNCSV